MTDTQLEKFRSVSPYTLVCMINSLMLTKRHHRYKQLIITAQNELSGRGLVDFNYTDILPAIEYLQIAITQEESSNLQNTIWDAVTAHRIGERP